jgi:outer membrane protein assembly factor BamB
MKVLAIVLLVACHKDKPPAPAIGSAPPAAPAPAETCIQLPFAESTPVPEASGAAWMTIDGKLSLVVISDSGNDGKYAIVDPETGATREQGKLPLGGPGEDLEGAAVRGGKLVVVTSPGWIRTWDRVANGFTLADGPYALGPIDLEKTTDGNEPPQGTGMVCDAKLTNCGRNYEGLCLAPEPVTGDCVGFVAAKADGHLYCLVDEKGRLAVRHAGAIAITKPGALADCAFAEDGALFAGGNFFDLSQVYRVDGWQAAATAKVEKVDNIGVGFPETIAARGDIIYRMSDTGGAPSMMAKYRCAR